MIFEALNAAASRGELLLVDGGMCHYHLCRKGAKAGQLTIREIIVLQDRRGQGIGTAMLHRLEAVPGATHIVAVCPADLPARGWYARRGFEDIHSRFSRTGRHLIVWRKWLAT